MGGGLVGAFGQFLFVYVKLFVVILSARTLRGCRIATGAFLGVHDRKDAGTPIVKAVGRKKVMGMRSVSKR